MKKIILIIITLGLMLIGTNIYAAGDLIVSGKLGIGTSTPAYKLSLMSTNERRGLSVDTKIDQDGILPDNFIIAADYVGTLAGSSTGSLFGMSAVMNLTTLAPTAQSLIAASFRSQIGINDDSIPGATTVSETVGFEYTLNRHWHNLRIYNIANSYGIRTKITEGSLDGAPINITNHYHHFIDDPGTLTTINISNLTGLWIDRQTAGTSKNYGLVLDGDGAGSDIVFGPNQEARIYSSSGRLYAQDSFGNQTILSPHDPETGEWIYYSRNIKTGKTVRVDMERLVKAVEKLTGETFMAETLIEDK